MIVLTEKGVEDLLVETRDIALHLEPPYNKCDFPKGQLMSDVFGSWNAALYKAGLITDKEFFRTEDGMQYLANGMKETASHLEPPYQRRDFPNWKLLIRVFGTWNAALRASGLMTKSELTGYESCFSDEFLKKKFEEVMKELGHIPRYEEFLPYSQTCRKKYGTWKKSIEFFGYDIKSKLQKEMLDFYNQYGRSPMKCELENGGAISYIVGDGTYSQALRNVGLPAARNVRLTDEELLTIIRETGQRLGRPPRVVDIPQASTIQRRFGSWNKALELAGYEVWQKTHDSKLDIPDSQLLSDIQVLILSNDGRSPYYREYDHSGLCVKRFGKWSKAIEKALEDPYNTMPLAQEIWSQMNEENS